MAGSFQITTRKNGEFQFVLTAGNRQTILTSEGYRTKQSCLDGVESVRKHSAEDANFERGNAQDGRPYFTLKASNGQVIGQSQMYAGESGRNKGIRSVMTHAAGAALDDRTAG